MHLYRITKSKFVRDLSGEGAKLYGGRWNRKGIAVLYTSQQESLAALETLVHITASTAPSDLSLAVLSIPDSLKPRTVKMEDLPASWRNYPAPNKLAKIGTEWATSKLILMLTVPSALVKTEWNVLINPAHSDIEHVNILEVKEFRFDSRLLQ